MARAQAAPSSASGPSDSPSMPTTPRRPPISSRPNPFIAPSPSSSSSSPSYSPSPSPSQPPRPSPSSPGAQWHRSGEYTILRFRVNPHPGLAPRHGGRNVALCFHNGYWRSSSEGGDGVTVHFDDSQRVMPRPTVLDESHTPPSAPNYIIQSNEVNLWIEDGDELALSRTPPLSTISRRPVMPLGQDHDRDTTNNERQPRRLTNNKLARWALYAVLFYLVVATFVTLLAPRPRPRPRQPWLEQVYQPTPVQPEAITDVLPVYERYENLCHRQTFYPRNSTFFALPLDTMEAHSMSRLNNACLPAKYIGAMWSREKGLTMDMDEHFYYKKSLEEGGPVYDGIDLWKLCSATDMAMMRASSGFKDVLSSLVSRVSQAGRVGLESLARELIYREYHDRDNATWSSHFEKPYTTGPAAPPTPTPDPSPLLSLGLFKHNTLNPERGMNLRTMARSGLESMNNLRQLLKNATQHLDQVLDITGQIIQDVTVQTPEEPPFWKRWFESFEDSFGRQEAVRKAKLLDETKDKMGFLLETRQNLTVVEAALEELVDEQEDILYEEDDISFWIQLLLDHASLSSQADTDDIVRLQDDKGDILIAGKWHANLWAQYRPKSEKEEYGQWCLYPDCPPAQGETVLVRLYVPNPTEAVKALFPIWLSLAKEDNELFMALHRRMKEKFGD